MTVTIDQIKEVVDTLPIGFYAKARVEVQIDTNAETSYFVPSAREIFISTKLIQATLASVKECDPTAMNKLIRGQVYHELSHAILTPQNLYVGVMNNIFEDERIEVLLKDFYRGVDFKWQIKIINDFDNLQKPSSAIQKFYQVVRFRVGEEEYLKIVDEIIQKFSSLNWNSDIYMREHKAMIDGLGWEYPDDYQSAIYGLYRLIEKDFKKNPTSKEDFQKQVENAKAQMLGEGIEEDNLPDSYDSNSAESGDEQAENGDEENSSSTPIAGIGKGEKKEEEHISQAMDLFNTAIENRIDTEFFKQMESILISFQKKNSGGGVINTYSGVFNPRSVNREDYRYFDRMAKSRNSGRYGTFHLNFFIDNSGSFWENATLANQIVCSLIELEKKYPFFTTDFALCDEEIHRCTDKAKFRVKPYGENDLPKGSAEIVKAMQRKNTFNYNIVLFDGVTDSYYARKNKIYMPFDVHNTTMIIDPTCQRDARTLTVAKVVVCRNYLEEVQKEMLKALQNALR